MVVGDIGLTLGTFFILKNTRTLDFLGTFEQAKVLGAGHHGDLTAGLILLLVGAFAKSPSCRSTRGCRTRWRARRRSRP